MHEGLIASATLVRVSRRLPLAILLAVVPAALGQQHNFVDPRSLAPFVPTPQLVVERMLEAAGVTAEDTVYDLGSGDGRIVITAVEKFHAKAVGIEINPQLVEESQKRIRELGLTERASVVQQHLLEVDLTPATVVTLYLLTSSNAQLRPKLERELKPGSRVVSHDFQIKGWTPLKTVVVNREPRRHSIFVYEIGNHKTQ